MPSIVRRELLVGLNNGRPLCLDEQIREYYPRGNARVSLHRHSDGAPVRVFAVFETARAGRETHCLAVRIS